MEFNLSICIPTLNRGSYIGETLESILNQIEPGVEIVIVDGGSTDNTEEIVKSYQHGFPDIRYVKKDSLNKAPSNEGFDRDCSYAVELARGEYSWLMTDDDLLKPGAIRKILSVLDKNYEAIIVNADVKNLDFTDTLVTRRLSLQTDCVFSDKQWDEFAVAVGSHLTFVGAVVIKREIWLARNKDRYFGSGFIHVGVIFSELIHGETLVVAQPLVSIRYGNAQWTTRAFQIWMINWPDLIWSFSSISDAAKQRITAREPWKSPATLLFNRALGMYSSQEYKLFIEGNIGSTSINMILKCIALLPRFLLYIPVWLYIRFILPDSKYVLFNLRESWKGNN
jgi:abequosyltransferase